MNKQFNNRDIFLLMDMANKNIWSDNPEDTCCVDSIDILEDKVCEGMLPIKLGLSNKESFTFSVKACSCFYDIAKAIVYTCQYYSISSYICRILLRDKDIDEFTYECMYRYLKLMILQSDIFLKDDEYDHAGKYYDEATEHKHIADSMIPISYVNMAMKCYTLARTAVDEICKLHSYILPNFYNRDYNYAFYHKFIIKPIIYKQHDDMVDTITILIDIIVDTPMLSTFMNNDTSIINVQTNDARTSIIEKSIVIPFSYKRVVFE